MAEANNKKQQKADKISNDQPLFPIAPGKSKPDYGTNDTLELLERIPTEVVNLKLDEVVTAVKTVDNLCDFPKCKARTSLMGQDCELCKKRFCFKHGQPEVHGCSDAVRKHEREIFLHPKPLKTVRQEQDLAKAKKKLQSKLKNMEFERKQKQAGAGGLPNSNPSGSSTGASGGGGPSGSRKKKGK